MLQPFQLHKSVILFQLSALIQEERIKQEFISFHALLIDEERKILENLRQVIFLQFIHICYIFWKIK